MTNLTPFEQLMGMVNQQGLLSLVKIVIVVSFGLYFVFSAVVTAQIKRMFETISTGAEFGIFLISLVHMGLSLLALVWAIMVL